MDLDSVKSDSWVPFWVRVAMLVCFAVAAAIFFVSAGGPFPVKVGNQAPHSAVTVKGLPPGS